MRAEPTAGVRENTRVYRRVIVEVVPVEDVWDRVGGIDDPFIRNQIRRQQLLKGLRACRRDDRVAIAMKHDEWRPSRTGFGSGWGGLIRAGGVRNDAAGADGRGAKAWAQRAARRADRRKSAHAVPE